MLAELKTQIQAAQDRARSLKTKAAQAKAYAKVRELRSQALDLLYGQRDAFARMSVKGTVLWFHAGDDYVRIETPYGSLLANPTSDEVSKSWYGHTCCVEYTAGQTVILELEVDVDSDRLCLKLIPKRILGGTLNEEQYAELCKRDDLAFFKYPGSTGVTGLFAQTKEVSHE